MSKSVSLVQTKIIKSILYGNYDIINISYGRIYTCGKDSKFWLYSGLEGALVFCIEVRAKNLRFLLFDLKTFEIVFDCELYKKFSNALKKPKDTFFYFGVNEGFIGIEIPDRNEAALFEDEILNTSDENVKSRLKEYKPMKENEIKERGKQMIQLLKQNFKSSGKRTVKSEIIINQGELEKCINTIDIDEKNKTLILTGSGYIGIDRVLKKVRGLKLIQNKNYGDNEIYSKYIARNILGSLMKGLVVPKRKINRQIWDEGEEITGSEPNEEEQINPKKEKKNKTSEQNTKIEIISGKGKGIPPPPPPPPPPPSAPIISTPSKNKDSKSIDLTAELEAKKNNLAHVDVKDYNSPALQNSEAGGGVPPASGNSMMAMIMAKRNQMKKGNSKIFNNTQSSKPNVMNPPDNKEVDQQESIQENNMVQKSNSKPTPPTKVAGRSKNVEQSNKVVSNKGKGIPPPPPPPPPPPCPPTNSNSNKKVAVKQVNLAEELAAKKNNLAHVEVKDYSSPTLQKQEDGGGGSIPQTGNNMMAMILAKRNQMKKVGDNTQPTNLVKSTTASKLNPSNYSQNNTITSSNQSNSTRASKIPGTDHKPTTNIGIQPPKKLVGGESGGFAAKMAALQARMGGGVNSNSNKQMASPSASTEPSKPIIELCEGNTKRMNINNVIGNLEKEKNRQSNKISSKPAQIKVVSGKGKGVPPPPPPPPPPPKVK